MKPRELYRCIAFRPLVAASTLVMIQGARATALTWDTTNAADATITDAAGTWSNGGTTWNNGTVSAAWSNATPDSATFSGAAGGSIAIAISGTVTQNGMVFNGASNYTLSGGSINGSGGVTKNGTSTVTFAAGTTGYTGATIVNSGTLVLTGDASSHTYSGGNLSINGASTLRIAGTRLDFSGKSFTFDATGGGTIDAIVGGQGGAVFTGNNSFVTSGGAQNVISGSGAGQGFNLNTLTATFNVATGTDVTSDLVVSATIFNTGSVVKTGAGRMTITGANSYTSGTTISAGSLSFTNGALGSSGTISMNGGALQWNGSNTQDVSGRLGMVAATTATFDTNGNNVTFASGIGNSNSSSLTKIGAGTLTLSGTATYTGVTTISAGSLDIAGAISSFASSGIVNNATMRFATTSGASGVLSYGNAISGTGTFTIDTTGSNGARLQLSGTALSNTNSWNVVNEGALWLNGSGTSGTAMNVNVAAGTGPGAYMQLNGSSGAVFNIGTLAGAGKVTNGGNAQTLVVGNGDGSATFSGVMSGATAFTKTGTGTQTQSGSNTYTGATTISNGTLSAGNIVVSAGSSNLGNATSAVTLGSASTQGTLSYTGNTATYTRGLTVGGAGGGRLNVTTSGQTLTIGSGTVTGTGLLTVGGAGNTTITSNVTHSGGLTKTDGGTLSLSGTNTYSGGTTISGGTLSAGSLNALGTGAVLINGGSLVSALANVSTGALSMSNGILAANGAGAGTYTLGINQNFSMSGGTLDLSLLNSSSYDKILGSGTGTFSLTGGTFDLTNSVTDYTSSYQVLNGFTSGSVSSLTFTNYDTTDYVANLNSSGLLSFTAVPEPGAPFLGGLGVLLLLRRRRA